MLKSSRRSSNVTSKTIRGGIQLGTSALRASAVMKDQGRRLTAHDFGPNTMAEVICEDGSVFRVSDAFIKEWHDPIEGDWLFLFCEHYPSLLFHTNDVLGWGNYERKW